MDDFLRDKILQVSGATSVDSVDQIQSLWSGYGEILKVHLSGSRIESLIVKHVRLPKSTYHPRGWNSDVSHQRKVKSYQVEMSWYEKFSSSTISGCRIPYCYHTESGDSEFLMILEDLDAAGYSARRVSVTLRDVELCLNWLAAFHARFLFVAPKCLWDIGCYWHLATRPDELIALDDIELRKSASRIDERLAQARFKTLVHGDAKLANFCFLEDGTSVAAVDFQYVGGGCGMKDVAYFIGSCLPEDECERQESWLLDVYFNGLSQALAGKSVDFAALESEWRDLYAYSWADFHRFLKGWSPGHWKINSYSERMTAKVLSSFVEDDGL